MSFANNFGRHDNVACGLICILPNKDPYSREERTSPIPLKSVNVIASVVHAVAQVELTQVYVNKEEQPIEAIYYFPVDSNGAVTHFHAELEGRTITGVVKPQEEAKEQYEKAISQKQTAFLGESNKPDIFKVKIGFLKPGTEVKVVIGYVTEVKNEKGSNALRFFIPTTVAPRYIPPTETDEKALDLKNMKFSTSTPAPLAIRVNVSIQGGIKTIESPTHSVTTVEKSPIPEKPEWTRGIAELTGKSTDMDRDFVLLITPDEVHVPRLYSEKFEGSTAVMTHLIPSFNLDEQKVELIFILDRSGSMMGESIELAKKALVLFLHSAPADCYFNVVGFGSRFEFLFPESVVYDDGSLKKAVAHASTLEANLGGTEIYAPLKAVYEKKVIPGYLRQIFVLTDGEVSNTEQVIGLVKAHAHSGRLFSLGIGDSSSHHLVEGLSEAGGGTSTFVTYQEKIETKVLHQLKNAIQPSLMDVELGWTGVSEAMQVQPVEINKEKTLVGYGKPITTSTEPPQATFGQVPKKIPPIYDGSQLLVFGLFTTEVPSAAVIKAQSPDGPLSVEIKLDDKNDLGSTGMIHKLAAVKMIRELEMEVAALGYVYDNNGDERKKREEALKKEITELSVKQGVCSKYTSFVAVDSEGDKKANESWVMQTRYVASQVAHGWHGGAFGAGQIQMAGGSMPSGAFMLSGKSTNSGFSFGSPMVANKISATSAPFSISGLAMGAPGRGNFAPSNIAFSTFGAHAPGNNTFGAHTPGNSTFGAHTPGNSTFGAHAPGNNTFSTFGAPAPGNNTFSTFGAPAPRKNTFSTFDAPAPGNNTFSTFGAPACGNNTFSTFGAAAPGNNILSAPSPMTNTFSTFGAPALRTETFSPFDAKNLATNAFSPFGASTTASSMRGFSAAAPGPFSFGFSSPPAPSQQGLNAGGLFGTIAPITNTAFDNCAGGVRSRSARSCAPAYMPTSPSYHPGPQPPALIMCESMVVDEMTMDDDDVMGMGLFEDGAAAPAPIPLMKRHRKKCSAKTASDTLEYEADEIEAPTSSDPLHALVATQSFNGSFQLNQAFAAVIGCTLADLENESKSKGWDNGAFATALALAYLEQKLGHLKESWELVASKAKKWLAKNFQADVTAILNSAAAFLTSKK